MRTAALTALILAWAMLAAAPPPVEAGAPAPNQLTNPVVNPMSGTTATVFTFSVRYRSFANDPALSVTASIPGVTLPMALTFGSALNGTWTTTSTLPAGSWTVTYAANATQFNDPTRTVGPVVVAVPPTPTPVPTPVPTPTPIATPRPPTPPPATPAPPPPAPPPPPPPPPAPAAPAPPVAPVPTPVPTPAPPTPAPSATASTSASASPLPVVVLPVELDIPFETVLGIAMASVLAVVGGWWIIAAGRRREQEDEPPPVRSAAALATVHRATTDPMAAAPAPTRRQPRERPPADWELASAFDDQPIGTVDFEGGTDEIPPEIQAALDAPVLHTEPGNARTRRIAQLRSQQQQEQDDRRSLLHRVGLPDPEED